MFSNSPSKIFLDLFLFFFFPLGCGDEADWTPFTWEVLSGEESKLDGMEFCFIDGVYFEWLVVPIDCVVD
jgi:hypothetical protein